jgi:hypothetical protein
MLRMASRRNSVAVLSNNPQVVCRRMSNYVASYRKFAAKSIECSPKPTQPKQESIV